MSEQEQYTVSVVVERAGVPITILKEELVTTPDFGLAREYARGIKEAPLPVPKSDPKPLREMIQSRPGDEAQVVVFTKRSNGKERRMVFQTQPPEDYKGGNGPGGASRDYDPVEKALVSVWDLEKEAFRSIPLDAVLILEQQGDIVFKLGSALTEA